MQNQTHKEQTIALAATFDVSDAVTLEYIFNSDFKSLTKDEAQFVKLVRYRKFKVGEQDFIDFSSNSLPQLREGNTISNGKWVRRGLPHLLEKLDILKSRKLELISNIKTNGDCCMFSWLETG